QSALNFVVSGGGNTAVGRGALQNATGDSDTGIGYSALINLTSGVNNTAIGVRAGQNSVTGTNNTFLGFQAGPPNANEIDNATAIGANAVVSASNAIVLGDN